MVLDAEKQNAALVHLPIEFKKNREIVIEPVKQNVQALLKNAPHRLFQKQFPVKSILPYCCFHYFGILLACHQQLDMYGGWHSASKSGNVLFPSLQHFILPIQSPNHGLFHKWSD